LTVYLVLTYLQVFVTIAAFNKFAPEFDGVWYNATVIEAIPAPVDVVTITASDRDTGNAGQVSYALVDSSAFNIDSTTGRMTTAIQLDREQVAKYQLTVLAYDHVSCLFC